MHPRLTSPSLRLRATGVLHTIFFHRFFPSVLPQTRDVLDLTLPYVADAEVETMIDQRTTALVRQLEIERTQTHGGPGPAGSGNGSGRAQIAVQFFEKRRRKAWYNVRGEEEICWERWTVKVTVAEPRTETGELVLAFPPILLYTTLPSESLGEGGRDWAP